MGDEPQVLPTWALASPKSALPVAELPQPALSPRSSGVSKHIPALDGLRGIAILAVFFLHYGSGGHSSIAVVRAFGTFVKVGWAGVDLFFVLSGFLITGILVDSIDDDHYYRNFYARRTLRIFPIYYLLCAVFVLVGLYLGVQWKAAHLWFLVYLGNPVVLVWPQLLSMILPLHATHLWSLAVEEQFYCIWPFAIKKFGSRYKIIAGSCILIVVAPLARLGFVLLRRYGWNEDWSTGFILCRMDALAVGALIAVLYRGVQREKMLKLAPVGFVSFGCALAALFSILHTTDPRVPVFSVCGFSLLSAFFGCVLLMALVKGSLTERVLQASGLRFFGRYSYGLYLYHVPLQCTLQWMQAYFTARTHSAFAGGVIFVFGSLLINVAVAMASFRFIEAPIMKLKARFGHA